MSAISSPTYDPATTATNLATAYVADAKAILADQTNSATAMQGGLSSLTSALSAFQSSLTGMVTGTGTNATTVSATAATFSNSSIASGTAKSTAVAGTYSFYVQQLATAGQVSYNVNDSAATSAGSLNVMLADGSTFQVDLANADSNMDGKLSAKEIAAAINIAASNSSRVTASTLTINGQPTLVLTSNLTGAGNAVASIDTSSLGDAGLQADLATGNQKVLATAKDAIINVGGAGGTVVQQASNTFNVVDDVSFTIKQAQALGDNPVTLTVAPDSSGTATNVQNFVAAYNKLIGIFNSLSQPGDHSATPPTADGPFYNDSGLSSLRSRLASELRAATGGQSLISFGISAQKDGTLSLDTTRLNKAVAANPGMLDTLFGQAGVGLDTGVLGSMDKLVNQWTNSATGLINSRQTALTKLQSTYTDRAANLQAQYDNAYKRYLAQFSALQQLQSSMNSNSNMFTAMFSSSSSSN